ncbi:zf-HC2 domain-containing protein [Kitasatospora sp. NPDC002965]|uniref:anti-sigma factor family protein n=1 Tax=Kitasatospora sp. NPDC002965 TaxID=3154775 RepID=UPI0033A8F4A0
MTAPLSSPDPAPATGPHPSVDELADLAEGLVEPADAAGALRRHLADCAECRETADALAEVRTLLGAAEAPPVPADVAARIDAALAAAAAEQDESAAARDESAAAHRTPGNALRGPGKDTAAPRPAHATPTPGTPAETPSRAPAGRPGATTGPGRPRTRRRRAALLLGSAAALLAVGLGGTFLALTAGADRKLQDTSTVSAGSPAAGHVLPGSPAVPGTKEDTGGADPDQGGGTAYRDELLAAQVQLLLAGRGSGTGTAAPPADTPDTPGTPVKPSRPPEASGATAVPPADTQGLTGGGRSTPTCPAPATGPLLATDLGSYGGTPAEVLVYGLPGRTDQVDVYLRAPGCGPVLLHRVVPSR